MHYFLPLLGLLEECDKKEILEETGAADAYCLKRRL
jgi:hypothetical protein